MHWRLGSVNVDREWRLNMRESVIAHMRADALRERREPEPIRCPNCSLVRASGPVCPRCNYRAAKSTRIVIQQNGDLREVTGEIYKPRQTKVKPNTIRLWERMYYRSKRAKRTFKAAEALFWVENRYWVPHNLPFMPKDKADWYRPVGDVPPDKLIPKDGASAPKPQPTLFA